MSKCQNLRRTNLRVLEIEEIKLVPYVPTLHPFVERLIATVRREFLDRVFFWNSDYLLRKLAAIRDYYNAYRVHCSLGGTAPDAKLTHIKSRRYRLR
jgi:putative transposase